MKEFAEKAKKTISKGAKKVMSSKKTVVALLLVIVALCGAAIGTIAWLTDKTDTVVNTFTVGNVDITLAETKTDFKMVPGTEIDKDPVATVVKDSEDCWLFVKVEESTNLKDFITYTIADGWTPGTGTEEGGDGIPTNVYYRSVTKNDNADQPFSVLKDDKVHVKDTVTKAMMDEIEAAPAKQPTLTFTAYAIQKEGYEGGVAEAWKKLASEK